MSYSTVYPVQKLQRGLYLNFSSLLAYYLVQESGAVLTVADWEPQLMCIQQLIPHKLSPCGAQWCREKVGRRSDSVTKEL